MVDLATTAPRAAPLRKFRCPRPCRVLGFARTWPTFWRYDPGQGEIAMRTALSWAGWLALLAAIVFGTITLLDHWSPRDSSSSTIEATTPAPAAPATPKPLLTEREQLQREILRLKLQRIRELQRQAEQRPKGERRCYSGTLKEKVDGAWTNVGRC